MCKNFDDKNMEYFKTEALESRGLTLIFLITELKIDHVVLRPIDTSDEGRI